MVEEQSACLFFQLNYDEGIFINMFVHWYDKIMIFTTKFKNKKSKKRLFLNKKSAILNSFWLKILIFTTKFKNKKSKKRLFLNKKSAIQTLLWVSVLAEFTGKSASKTAKYLQSCQFQNRRKIRCLNGLILPFKRNVTLWLPCFYCKTSIYSQCLLTLLDSLQSNLFCIH